MQVLEKYQVYGDSVLGLYGPRPNVREVIKVRMLSYYFGRDFLTI